ncbi:unnamed protein product [Urochloa decumbens]|uniref:Inhibitor I9 domain-containing protein n=1 Tax=Urochloa decumbens TaxID=240449 RepID=A0ABC9A590_9POAL
MLCLTGVFLHAIKSMASHQLLAARSIALLLLLAVVPFTTAELEERKPHVEPADEGGYKTYIVQLERPAGGPGEGQDITDGDADAHRAWHQSFLPSMTTALGKPRLLRSYRTVFTGFAARLTEEELKEVSAKPGFVRSLPNVIVYVQTTRTPTFLGLPNCMGESPNNWPVAGGRRVISGVSSCHQDMKCNGKLIGTKNMYSYGRGYLPLDMDNGHAC